MRENPWLTRREKRVFDLIYVDGLTSYDAAAELDISRRTVFNDLASIRKKCT
ncbi:sigma factor-like helix-turn-helix DNA-binding protein [Evtepia sp.]|uniref:sigma factor-like helix-turn-helix DNA-binding protein n=1 Tax=Evtepia sp. TaxID=2773933 RepID=UPI003F14C508